MTTNIQNCTRGNQGELLCYHNSKEQMCGTKCGGTLVQYTETNKNENGYCFQNELKNDLLRNFNEYFMSATGTKSATTKS